MQECRKMRKYTDSLDCRNISTAGAKMYGYSNLPIVFLEKKEKAVRHQKVNSYNGNFFLFIL